MPESAHDKPLAGCAATVEHRYGEPTTVRIRRDGGRDAQIGTDGAQGYASKAES